MIMSAFTDVRDKKNTHLSIYMMKLLVYYTISALKCSSTDTREGSEYTIRHM